MGFIRQLLFTSAQVVVSNCGHGPVSRQSRELFGSEKPFVKLRPAYSVKLVFSYVVKVIKIKITAKFRASRRRYKENYVTLFTPEKFGDFRETGPRARERVVYIH